MKTLFYRNLAGYYIYYLQHLNINTISKENKIDNRTIKKKKSNMSYILDKYHNIINLCGCKLYIQDCFIHYITNNETV